MGRTHVRTLMQRMGLRAQAELDDIAWQINTRPRKSFGWKCSVELFMPDNFDTKAHFDKLAALEP